MSRYLYKKIQNISPESLDFQHSGLKLTTLGSDPMKYLIGKMVQYRWKSVKNGMRYGHGLNARTAGCATAGQIQDSVLRNT